MTVWGEGQRKGWSSRKSVKLRETKEVRASNAYFKRANQADLRFER